MKNKKILTLLFILLTNSLYGSQIHRRKSINPLIRAVMLNQTEHAIDLVERGQKVNVYDEEGHSPLYYSVEKNNEQLTLFLLQRDIGLWEIPVADKIKCLHFAIERGFNALVKAFVISWACVEGRNSRGDTPLISAVRFGNYEATDILLLGRATCEDQDLMGNTALHIASENGDIALVRLLLCEASSSECLKIKNKKGKNPGKLADKSKNKRVKEAIEAKGSLLQLLEDLAAKKEE